MMKPLKYLVRAQIAIFLFCASAQLNSQTYPFCGFDRMVEKQAMRDSSVYERLSSMNRAIEEAAREIENLPSFRTEILIPVVVHVVWHSAGENSSDETIRSQIEILNRDFNGGNSDLSYVPNEFKPLIAQMGIHFCLASEDPQGFASSGIIRVQTLEMEIGGKEELFFSGLGGSDAWDTERYLNVWVANTGDFVTGYGSFPGQTEPEKSGVVVHPRFFGINSSGKFGEGRVAVHEVGHFLGLNHLWGDDGNCETDDGVTDTPLQQHPYEGCPDHPQTSCGSSDLFPNFMDFVDDPCMLLFTQGQMERMQATLENFRPGLLDSAISCVPTNDDNLETAFSIFPNPAKNVVFLDFQHAIGEVEKVEIYNSLGQLFYRKESILSEKMKIDLPNLPPGIYFIKVRKGLRKLVVG